MKKKLIVILMFLLILTGCKSGGPIANKDGTILSYKINEADPGFYIKEDNKVYPLLEKGIITSPKLMQWSKNYDQIIPTLNNSNELVFLSESKLPGVFEFTKMENFGHTIGALFSVKKDDKGEPIVKFTNNTDPTSAVSKRISEISKDAWVTEINSYDFDENLLSEEGLIRGLDEDGLYTLYYYVGTKYHSIQLKAETKVFVEDYTITSTGYTPQKENYFTIKIPEDLEKGYYILNKRYMFYYE